jgi:hypothetical protein
VLASLWVTGGRARGGGAVLVGPRRARSRNYKLPAQSAPMVAPKGPGALTPTLGSCA